MKELTLEEIRKIQLEILDAVHKFCMERNLRYSLGGGTLLGAVRHKGYIPWDDDIDIMMPRPDYERFIKEFTSHIPHYICGCCENDHAFPHLFTKIYDDRTILKEWIISKDLGVNIDVFPIDGLPDDSLKLDKLLQYLRLIKIVFRSRNTKIVYIGNIVKYIARIVLRVIPNYWLFKKTKKRLMQCKFGSSKKAGAVLGVYDKKEVYDTSIFASYNTMLQFEDRQYCSIASYHEYLEQHYGDYMQLPPEENRVRPHSVSVVMK